MARILARILLAGDRIRNGLRISLDVAAGQKRHKFQYFVGLATTTTHAVQDTDNAGL